MSGWTMTATLADDSRIDMGQVDVRISGAMLTAYAEAVAPTTSRVVAVTTWLTPQVVVTKRISPIDTKQGEVIHVSQPIEITAVRG